jgi:small-conductance mechanosensitive channel
MFLQPPTPAPTPAPPATLTEVFAQLHADLLRALPGMFRGVLVFLIFWIVAGAGRRVIALAAPRVRADTGVVLLLSRVYYYGILIFGTVTALGAAGMNVSALVTGLGLTGFALGFALKDVLSNLLSGIMLLLYRPFNIGDYIRMGEYEGTIETIRMRDTLVRAGDGRLIVIPNTKLITEVVVNHTHARPPDPPAGGDVAVAAATPPRRVPSAAPAETEEYWQPPQ